MVGLVGSLPASSCTNGWVSVGLVRNAPSEPCQCSCLSCLPPIPLLQIDQSTDPTRVTIAGSPQSLQLAVSMVNDIVRGTFKGFAMLRQIALSTSQPGMPGYGQPQPVYVQGYGFVPPSQVYNPDDPLAAQMMRSSPPSGPLTPPMTPLRGPPSAGALGGAGLTPEALAALLGQQGGMPGMPDFSGAAGSQGAGSSTCCLLAGSYCCSQPCRLAYVA